MWDANLTPSLLDQTKIDLDTTLTYAQHIGFRCGTCYEYALYDLNKRKPLKIIESPLIVMEVSLLRKNYMNIDTKDLSQRIMKLKNVTYKFNGNFTILWHNHELNNSTLRSVYEKVI